MKARQTIGQVAKALYANGGNVARTSRLLGLGQAAVWNRISRHPELVTALAQAREKASVKHVCKACGGTGIVG